MHIQSIPAGEEEMYTWYEAFERNHYGYSDEGKKIVEALANEFAERWYPRFMRYHGTQYYYSLFDDYLLQILQIKKPHFFYRYAVKCYMWFQLRVLFQLMPDASDRNVLDYYTTDYPDYDISKVGPFAKHDKAN
jgi:hypothetical protein